MSYNGIAMNNRNLSSQAWILHGLTGSTAGVLTLRNERLSFESADSRLAFDAALNEVSEIKFPWHLFGGGLTFGIGADNYRVSFVRPGNTTAEADFGDVTDGRENCKKWKTALLD